MNPFLRNTYSIYILPAAVVFYAVGWISVWAFDAAARRAESLIEFQEEQGPQEAER